MKGKNKCKILKEIRQRIADENDIPYVTRECGYQGECRGTCPKCEAELRYLEQELEKRRRLGKTVAVAAVAAGLSLSLAACTPGGTNGSTGSEAGGETVPAYTLPIPTVPNPENAYTAVPELQGRLEVLEGELVPYTTEEPAELLGDVAVLPETPEDIPPETFDTPENLPAAGNHG